MNQQDSKSREQLLQEVAELQRRVAGLEASEELLQASEVRLRAVLANNTIAVFDHDRELRYIRIYNPNPNFTVEGVVGKTDADLFLPEDAAQLTEIKRRVLATGAGERQIVQVTLNGETFYYDLTVEPRLDPMGQVIGLACAAMDITERKRAEKALQANEYKFRQMIERSTDGTLLYDETGRLIEWNSASERISGISRTEVVGKLLWDNIFRILPQKQQTPERYEQLKTEWLTYFQTGQHPTLNQMVELEIWHRDGSGRTIETARFPIKTEQGYLLGTVLRDITERKRMEVALRESKERLELVLKAAELGTWDWHTPSGELVVNERWAEMLGYSLAEVEPHISTWEKLIHPDDASRVLQATQANLEGQTPLFHEEYRVRARSGEWKWVLDVGKVMAWDEQGRPVRAAGIHQDITVRKQAEEALRESKEWLELVVTAADLGTWDFRVSTNQVVYNRRWAEMLGYTLAELESTINGWEKLIHPEDFAGVRAAVNAHMRGEIHLYQHEHRLRSKSGEWQWVMDTGQAVEQDEQGRPVRVVGIQQDITERKRTEAALRASEARFATIFQASPLSISIVRLTDHQFVDVNWAWETKSGFSREETIGRTPLELNLWVNPDARAQFLMQLSEQSTVQGLEAQFRLKSGVVVDVLISAELIDLPGERCMLMITQNITERKRMEVELRTSEQKFRQLIEQSADGFVLTDHRGYVSEWNRMAEQITGLTRAETMGRPSWELQFALLPAERRTPATFERLKTFVQAYLQTGEDPLFNQAYEFELQGSDGSYRDIQEVGFPIKTEAGFWRGGIIRDVTERRQVERIETAQLVVSQVLAQSPEPTVALRQVLEAIAQRMNWDFAELWRPNHDNRRLVWQNGWYTPDLPILAEFMQTGQTLTFEPGQGLVGKVWQTGQTIWDQNLHLPVRSSTMLVTGLHSVTGVPIIEDGETVGVMVFFSRSTRPLDERLLTVLTDLGRQIGQFLARKQAEADLAAERASLARRVEERTAELSQANADLTRALRVKNEFMSTVTHELRTPLMGILGMSEIMQEQFFGPLNERQLEQVKLIEMSGQRLLGLVNNILDLTHLEASKMVLQPEKISVAEMCRVSVQSVSEAAHKKNLTLSCHLPDQSLYLQADPPRLQQILVNLLDNAIKFTPAGGQVSLEVTPDPADKLVHFAVQDNGIGIKVEQMERLFQPFTQLDSSLSRSYEGTGLGLALVRRLAELHGGTVSVESKGVAGKGSRFIVSLPWQVPHQ